VVEVVPAKTLAMTTAHRAAIEAYPQLGRLLDLKASGPWVFRLGKVGEALTVLLGYRVWPDGWSEAIAIRNDDDVRAFRCDSEAAEVWAREGTLAEVLDGLLELPAPDTPGAPRLAKGTAPKLWIPGVPR
jgi:hypothetical protein